MGPAAEAALPALAKALEDEEWWVRKAAAAAAALLIRTFGDKRD